MQNYHKKYLLLTILFAFLMFVWVIVAVSLTGGREISDFTEQDRLFFTVFGAVELLNLFLLFLFAKKARKTPLPEAEPFPVDKVQRRRGVLLFISALMLGFGSWFLGLRFGRELSPSLLRGGFWSFVALTVVIFGLSLGLDILFNRRLSKRSLADMSKYIDSHREAGLDHGQRKLLHIKRIRVFTKLYTLFLTLLALALGFFGGALTAGSTDFQTLIVFLSAFVYLSVLSRIHFPQSLPKPEDDPFLANREDYPVLYSIARKAAESQGWQGDIQILLHPECNAGIQLQRNTCRIHLGVLLLDLLTEEELLSVFCHEFSHIAREQDLDQTQIRHNVWLNQGGNPHFLNTLTSLFFAFLNTLFLWHFQLYLYAVSLSAEEQADQAMVALTNPETAASALTKLKYHDMYQWEFGSMDIDPLYAPEAPDPQFLHRQSARIRTRTAQRQAAWNDLIDREIISRRASHPTVKMRLEGLGVSELPAITFPDKDILTTEREAAMSFAAKTVCDGLADTYADSRKEVYLEPLAQVENWEFEGKPVSSLDYRDIVTALQCLGRNREADSLCRQAIEQLSGPAACFAHFSHGCFLLRSYDDSGIDHIYKAIAGNSNYIEEGLEMIGQYCCLTGNQGALDSYRQQAVELLQKTKDVYSQISTLQKHDQLSAETLPEGMLEALLDYTALVDNDTILEAYLVHKQITQEDFTSAYIVHFKEGISEEEKERVLDKLFAYLDTSTDWQFSLFDYDHIPFQKIRDIPGSCVYRPEHNQ